MSETSLITAAPGASARKRINGIDIFMWVLRCAVAAIALFGTVATLLEGRYSLAQWFDFAMFGLTLGSVYALIALGYTMVYGVLRMINFAHGDITMTGAFAGYFVATGASRSGLLAAHPILAILAIFTIAMVTCIAVALATERFAYRPFRNSPGQAPLICAIGVSFVLEQTVRGMFGSGVKSYPVTPWQDAVVTPLGMRIPVINLFVMGCAISAMVILYLIVHRTRMGMAMRAVSEDKAAASLMGVDVDRVVVFAFALGGAMAGVASVCYALIYQQVHFFMGFAPGIKAFGAAVLGGIGSIPGAMVGGMFLGLIEAVGPALFLDGLGITAPYQLRDAIGFLVLLMVLIFRPQGLFGEAMAKKRA
ncbi:branched-chain amino acid ABC transporter permease [Mesorhizobium sp. BH1-1-5]|uniref:branched-chain amino acid ABC transporter permease n=1 Tax=unclassified Mesorhizobium TaxID=325217 RepID=UPI00112A2866|nr:MULTISPECIES: branched-chain amino acid ABC transporter permease [unclassified Mesorhizobium]MBZ9991544.1 branched-chain amino acid ABC transporter permease [Mesorhizobium sp. BH1-1-5]TPJ74591.1 branched-chain amino acid ABC transporter permease [Mesorhizobium sp. B2-7-1]